MPLAPTSWNKANRVKWTLGTFASKAFAHLLIMAMVHGAQKSFKHHRINGFRGSSTHYFFSLGVRWASTWRCQRRTRVFFWKKKHPEISGSFFDAKIQTKKMESNWFFQLMEAMKSTNALRIGLRLSDQPVFGAAYILREKTWRAWCVLKGLPRRIPCPQLTCL